ncbi:TraR/DksA C4-type zinc finger protein [Streptomyces sp. S1A(2023)]
MVAKKTAEETAAEHDGTHEPPVGQKPAPAKSTAKNAGSGEAASEKAASKKTVDNKKSAAKKASRKAAVAATEAATAAEQTGAHTVVAKKSASRHTAGAQATAPVPPARAAAPDELAVRPGEDPWTPEEVTEARTLLTSETLRLRSELEASGAALAGLMRDSGDGAGDDEADTGTKNITREHELSLAAHAQETLEQTERALARLEAGTYGLCEVCGKPIGKARMQAFPRATLCVEDKQKQERRG